MNFYMFRDKVIQLFNKWKRLKQNQHQTTEKASENRNQFMEEAGKLFDLAKKDAVETIQKDRLRSEIAKKEDIEFLLDQRSNRVFTMSSEDKKYSKAVERKVKRDARSIGSTQEMESNDEKDSSCPPGGLGENLEQLGEEGGENDDDSEDFVYVPKKKKKMNIVVEIPKNIGELTAENAVRRGISATAHASIIANVVNVSAMIFLEANSVKFVKLARLSVHN